MSLLSVRQKRQEHFDGLFQEYRKDGGRLGKDDWKDLEAPLPPDQKGMEPWIKYLQNEVAHGLYKDLKALKDAGACWWWRQAKKIYGTDTEQWSDPKTRDRELDIRSVGPDTLGDDTDKEDEDEIPTNAEKSSGVDDFARQSRNEQTTGDTDPDQTEVEDDDIARSLESRGERKFKEPPTLIEEERAKKLERKRKNVERRKRSKKMGREYYNKYLAEGGEKISFKEWSKFDKEARKKQELDARGITRGRQPIARRGRAAADRQEGDGGNVKTDPGETEDEDLDSTVLRNQRAQKAHNARTSTSASNTSLFPQEQNRRAYETLSTAKNPPSQREQGKSAYQEGKDMEAEFEEYQPQTSG